IYNTHSTATNKWSAGPSFPANFFPFDAPAAILPSGNVLVMASNNFAAPSQFFEFDGTNLSPTAVLPRQGSEPAFVGSMLVLPTGQIMFTDESQDVEVFTSSDPFNPAWAPTISSSPGTVMIGGTSYSVSGTQFNGLTQGAMYGDDAQMATNFPLVLITNNATGDAVFARTHNHSTMAVATGTATVSTKFDVPFSAETGPSTLQVIANGIPSSPVNVNVVSGPFPVDLSGNFNVTGMYWDTSTFSASGSLDGIGHSYSENLLGSLVSWNNIPLFLGPPDPDSSLPNAIQPNGDFVDLGAFGGFSQLRMLATSVDGNSPGQTFTLNYTDGTTASFTQSFSNWTAAQNYSGETKVVTMPYRDKGDGTKSTGTTYLYGYTFHLDSTKSLNFMILPVAKNLRILAMTVAP
ncbi:MAG TPA: hypothetical protein VFA71_06265, partial [Terriglobales bacterium]|nr:hypothetical protein [Terriglobales bacterium]